MIQKCMGAALGFLTLLCTQTSAQEYRLAEHLPAGTLAYFAVPNANAFRGGVNQLGVAKLFLEPEGRKLARGIHAAVQSMLQGVGPEQQAIVTEVLGLVTSLQGEVAIALIDVDEQRGMPLFAASLDFGANVDRFKKVLSTRLGEYAERGYEIGAYDLEGHSVATVNLGPVVLHHAFLGGAWIATNDATRVSALLAAPAAGHFAGAPDFAASSARVLPQGKAQMMHMHVNLAALYERFAPMIPEEVNMILQSFELNRLHALSYGMTVENGAVVERMRIHAPEGLGSLGDLVDTEPTAHRALRMVPDNAFLYASQRVRFDGMATFAQRAAAVALPGGQADVDRFLDQFEQNFGFRLETDFAQNLGPEVAYYAAFPEGGGLIPEFAFGIQVKDGARFVEHVQKMLRVASQGEASAALEVHDYMGKKYHSLEIELPQNAVSLMPLRPCLLIQGDAAIMTLFPHTMKAVIERLEAGGAKPSLADDPDFAALFVRAPQGHQSFSYFRAKGLLGLLYNTAVPLAQSMGQRFLKQNMNVELDLIDLPSAGSFAKHLVDLAGWSTVDPQGMESTMVSPIGIVPMVALMVAPAAIFMGRSAQVAQPIEVREGEEEVVEEWEIDEEGNLRRKR